MTYTRMSEYKGSLGCLFCLQLQLVDERANMKKKKEIIGGSFRAEYSLSINPQDRYIILNSNTNIHICTFYFNFYLYSYKYNYIYMDMKYI